MATQEERLTILEKTVAASQKFQEQAAAHIQETEENTTILLGVIRSQAHDIKRTLERLTTIDTRLDRIEVNLGEHTTRLDAIDTHLATIDTRLDTIDTHLATIDTTLGEHTTLQESGLKAPVIHAGDEKLVASRPPDGSRPQAANACQIC